MLQSGQDQCAEIRLKSRSFGIVVSDWFLAAQTVIFLDAHNYETGFAPLGNGYWGLQGPCDDVAGFAGEV